MDTHAPAAGSGQERLCPSARCEEGAILLGVVGPDGAVGYVTPELRIDRAFVERAHQGRAPEKRFRFSQPCVEAGCRYWTGSQCAVIQGMRQAAAEADPAEIPLASVPKCSIRPRCRWFAQEGAAACRVCSYVITNLWPEEGATDNPAV